MMSAAHNNKCSDMVFRAGHCIIDKTNEPYR